MKDKSPSNNQISLTKRQSIIFSAILAISVILPLTYYYEPFRSTVAFYDRLDQLFPPDYVEKVTRLVSSLTALPKDEPPRVYTIKDVSKVQNDKFF